MFYSADVTIYHLFKCNQTSSFFYVAESPPIHHETGIDRKEQLAGRHKNRKQKRYTFHNILRSPLSQHGSINGCFKANIVMRNIGSSWRILGSDISCILFCVWGETSSRRLFAAAVFTHFAGDVDIQWSPRGAFSLHQDVSIPYMAQPGTFCRSGYPNASS